MSVIKFMKLMIRRTKLIVLCTYKFILVFRRLFVGFSGIWEVSNYKITKIFISTQSKKGGKFPFGMHWQVLSGSQIVAAFADVITECCLLKFVSHTKGQSISKCLLGAIVSTKKTNEIFLRISALASKKRLNQKLYYTKYVKQPLNSIIKCLHFFDLTSF